MSQLYYEPLQYGEEETNQLFGIVHDGLYVGAIVETKSWHTNTVSWKTYGCPEAMETLPKSHGSYLIGFSHELIAIASTSMLSDAKRKFRAWFKDHGYSRPEKQQPSYRCYKKMKSKYAPLTINDEMDTLATRDARLEQLWDELTDVPLNPATECIEEAFYVWPAGTDRLDIWHWFDDRYSKGVAALLYKIEEGCEYGTR